MCGDTVTGQVQQLREDHPAWWVWYSSNVGFLGFYAIEKDETLPDRRKLNAAGASELAELIMARQRRYPGNS